LSFLSFTCIHTQPPLYDFKTCHLHLRLSRVPHTRLWVPWSVCGVAIWGARGRGAWWGGCVSRLRRPCARRPWWRWLCVCVCVYVCVCVSIDTGATGSVFERMHSYIKKHTHTHTHTHCINHYYKS
jgi:hypothetical protein